MKNLNRLLLLAIIILSPLIGTSQTVTQKCLPFNPAPIPEFENCTFEICISQDVICEGVKVASYTTCSRTSANQLHSFCFQVLANYSPNCQIVTTSFSITKINSSGIPSEIINLDPSDLYKIDQALFDGIPFSGYVGQFHFDCNGNPLQSPISIYLDLNTSNVTIYKQ